MANVEVVRNDALHQFEVTQEGETAVLTYRETPGTITFLHTGVPEVMEGRGIASRLTVAGLTFAREHGLRVVPLCPFVADYIERHPQYRDLVGDTR
ncbi:MAG: GNAT family N-acetyltransferase [Vicinamibacterales bacterium]